MELGFTVPSRQCIFLFYCYILFFFLLCVCICDIGCRETPFAVLCNTTCGPQVYIISLSFCFFFCCRVRLQELLARKCNHTWRKFVCKMIYVIVMNFFIEVICYILYILYVYVIGSEIFQMLELKECNWSSKFGNCRNKMKN